VLAEVALIGSDFLSAGLRGNCGCAITKLQNRHARYSELWSYMTESDG